MVQIQISHHIRLIFLDLPKIGVDCHVDCLNETKGLKRKERKIWLSHLWRI